MPESAGKTSGAGARAWAGVIGYTSSLVGLLAGLFILILHLRLYWFLTDDAFISFRYARNFSDGYGLVFNPGFERVEGYSNFLWVLILAAGNRLGWPPQLAANWLSAGAHVVLWALVASFCARRREGGVRAWLAAFPG